MFGRLKQAGLYFISLFFIGVVAATVVAIYWLANPGSNDQAARIIIKPGDTVPVISKRLAENNVVDNTLAFSVMARVTNLHRQLQAGEYEFPARANLALILTYLAEGQTKKRFITIPEGLTSYAIVKQINDAPAINNEIGDIPVEGSLLPDTYAYGYGMTGAQIIDRMQSAMDDFVNRVWQQRQDDLPITNKEQAVILASIIEKETGVAGERAKVAGVFINRLEKGMRLQSDPTVVYGITHGEKPLGRPLYRSDWQVDSPYNTYRIDGLPPTPICNPGRAAIKAAVNPVRHDYLYFVAAPGGGHKFATNLADHNRNVASWRKHKRQQQNE